MLDLQKLTLGEVAKVEELSGLPIDAITDDEKPKGKALAALVLVFKRREELAAGLKPSFTWNDALALDVLEASAFIGMTDDDEDHDENDVEHASAPDFLGEAADPKE